MKSRSFRVFVTIASAVIVGSFIVGVVHADYQGSGYFPTNTLKRCHEGSYYSSQAQYASATWSAATDLNMVYSCSAGWHIKTSGKNYGNTGWVGSAYVCAINGQCNNTSAQNTTYLNCLARLNEYYLRNNTSDNVKAVALHEMGHCYSLAHRNVSTSVMHPTSVSNIQPNSTDVDLINARY